MRDGLRVPDGHAEYAVSERRLGSTPVIFGSFLVCGIVLMMFAPPWQHRCLASMVSSLLRLLPLGLLSMPVRLGFFFF